MIDHLDAATFSVTMTGLGMIRLPNWSNPLATSSWSPYTIFVYSWNRHKSLTKSNAS